MRFLIAALILVSTAAAQAAAPANDVPIRIFADGDPPSQVLIEDHSGTKRFLHVSNYWEGRDPSTGAWAVHKLVLFYSDNPVPIALRTLWTQPRLDVTIVYRRYKSCNPADVAPIRQAAAAGTASARIQAVIGARQLLMLTANACPPFVRRELATLYLEASCSLARDTDYFVLSEEAKDLFIAAQNDKAQALARVAMCEKDMRRAEVQPLLAMQDQAIQEQRLADFASINAELASMRAQPQWADVLADSDVARHVAQSSQIGHLLLAAQTAQDPDQAVATHAALLQIGRDPRFAEVVKSTGLDVAQLEQRQSVLQSHALQAAVTRAAAASAAMDGPR